jgi:hypothetical protein
MRLSEEGAALAVTPSSLATIVEKPRGGVQSAYGRADESMVISERQKWKRK